MKNIYITFILLSVSATAFAQTNKTIIITKYSKVVPTGKKWILESGKTTKIQVGYGVLNSGSMCNALFLSNPRIISNITRGSIYNGEGYGIIFKDLEKVPYTNDYTYELTPISFYDKNFSVSELQYKKAEDVGVRKLEFKAGESVSVSACLESIELIEVNISAQELQEVKKEEIKQKKNEDLKLANFNIPVNPEKYVEPNTIPELHDKGLKQIEFSSPAVLFKKPGKRFSLDDVSKWTILLTSQQVTLTSTNGINKTYPVIKIEYDSGMRMQKFSLGNSDNNITHELSVAWSVNSKRYYIMLISTDKTEEYQFQEVAETDKQYQASK